MSNGAMFKKPGRPRAPSTATLRILYQLAYISSGTALGVGALCAEERRRRMQVVQHIAENAKRLRQSPRYNHNTAQSVAAVDTSQYEFRANGTDHNPTQDRAFVGPELPSVIDREYNYTPSQAWKPPKLVRKKDINSVDKRVHTGRSTSQNSLKEDEDDLIERMPMRSLGRQATKHQKNSDSLQEQALANYPRRQTSSRRGEQTGIYTPDSTTFDHRNIRPAGLASLLQTPNHHSTSSMEKLVKRNTALLENSDILHISWADAAFATPNKESKFDKASISEEQTTVDKKIHTTLEYVSSFKTQEYWEDVNKRVFWKHATAICIEHMRRHLSHDVTLLLDTIVNSRHIPIDTDKAVEYARPLSVMAAKLGHLRDATSLLLWKIAIGHASVADTMLLAECWNTFVDKRLSWNVRQPSGRECRVYSQQGHKAPVPGTDQDPGVGVNAFEAGAHQSILRSWTSDSDLRWVSAQEELVRKTASSCRILANGGFVGAGAYMMTAIPFECWPEHVRSPLLQELFSSAVQSGELSLCDLLLKWTGGSLVQDVLPDFVINAFIAKAGATKAYDLLSEVFTGHDYDPTMYSFRTYSPTINKSTINSTLLDRKEVLNATSFRQLAHAFSTQAREKQPFLGKSLKPLQEQERQLYHTENVNQQVSLLMSTWAATQDIEVVRERYNALMARRSIDTTEDWVSSLHITMSRIYLLAGKLDAAKDTVAAVESSTASFDTYLITMLTHAKENDWVAVKRMLKQDIQAQQTVHVDMIRQILTLYSEEHSVDELFDFSRQVIEALNLSPTPEANKLILQSFVIHQRADLITKWLALCRGWKVKIDAHLVSLLLHKYSLTHRPQHQMIMGTAHRLSKHAPALINGNTRHVVNQAIVYDMRHYRQGRQGWQWKNANQRLRHLNKFGGLIPHPGHVWNNELTLYKDGGFDIKTLPEDKCREQSPHDSLVDETDAQDPPPASAQQETLAGPFGLPDVQSAAVAEDEATTDEQASWTELRTKDAQRDDIAVLALDQTDSRPLPSQSNISIRHGVFGKGPQHQKPLPSDPRPKMLVALTVRNYERVLSLYEQTCTPDGRPFSPIALDLAIQASPDMNGGNTRQAHDILNSAVAAGQNPASALVTLLLHRIKIMPTIKDTDVKALTKAVLDCYQLQADIGSRAQAHLAVAAANRMIQDRLTLDAIRLLETVYEKYWKNGNTINAVVYTVWMKAYICRRDISGVCTLVDRMLDTNTKMDDGLINTLDLAIKRPELLKIGMVGHFDRDAEHMLRECRSRCSQRRKQQKENTSRFLPRLSTLLIQHYEKTQKISHRHNESRQLALRKTLEELNQPEHEITLQDNEALDRKHCLVYL